MAQMQPPTLAAGVADLGPVPAAQSLQVTLHLAPSAAQTAALQQFLVDVETPGSASYHLWLTPAQFGERFGPSADQIAAVQAFAAANGLSATAAASPSGMRLTLRGTATQLESALAPSIHSYRQGAIAFYANTAAPSLPSAIASQVLAIDGLSTAPGTHPMTMLADAAASTVDDPLAALTATIEANNARVIALSSTACVEDFDQATQAAMQLVLREAVAQGMTVLAASGCGSRGSAGFPSSLSEAAAVAVAPGVTPASDATLTELRPGWQQAVGLPADVFRHEPDVTVSSVAALAQTFQTILAREPANADGLPARLGNVAATLYRLATEPGLYTQPDGAAPGTWEAATGLGVVSLPALAHAFPDGASPNNVQLTIGNPGAVHGQNIAFTANVTNTSGNNALPAPTGTVTFVTNTGVTVGTGALVNGTYTANYNQLPANSSYTVVAQYSGDDNYEAANSVTDSFSVTPEASVINGAAVGSVPVGGMITVNVSDSSNSDVGTPSGQATVIPQYIQTPPTYTGTLSGTGGTSTATVKVPATLAGNVALKVNCVSTDPSFTCFVPLNITATVTLGTTTTTLSVSPSTVVTNQPVTFTATVTGAGAGFPTPTGNVAFYDYAAQIGSAQVNGNGVATLTLSNLDGSVTHNFTATYMGDSNYSYSNATNGGTTGTSKTTTGTLTVNPNPPVNGTNTTLTDTIQYTNSGTAPSGTVTFYEDGGVLGTGPVNGGAATYNSAAINGTGTHTFYAVYAGDANYTGNTSNTVATGTSNSTTTTTITANPTTVASGGTTTLTATVTPAATINNTAPTGNVTFTSSLQGVLGVVSLNGTTATLSPTLTTAGTQNITATYGGDGHYTISTTATPASVTVGPTTAIVVTATPASVAYGSPETIAATVTATTNNGVGPSGQLNFTLYGTVQASASTQLTATSSTTSTGTTTASALAPGTYDVQTACTGYNFNCANVQVAQAQFTVVKANTTTTLTSNPTTPVVGQSTTFTAVVANANTTSSSSATAPSGSVTFYDGSSAGATVAVAGGQATFTTTISSTSSTISAVYSGDTNYNSSNSATTITVAPVVTTAGITASATSGLAGSVIVLTASIAATPTTANPTPSAPSGTVTFYDVYNGQTVPLGSASLATTGATISIGQLSTTGLKVGSHSITAVFATTTGFVGSTSNAITISLSDFSLSFSPASLTLTRGISGSATATISALNGFTGTVSLACTPPSGTLTTCSFTPATINGSGVSQLVITTTQPAVKASGPRAELERTATGVTLALLLFGFLLPGAKKRRPMLLALLLSVAMFGTLGCTDLINSNVSPPVGPGTPLGTVTFSITASGTDGKTIDSHGSQFQVTVNQ
jgi:hypothetical protein